MSVSSLCMVRYKQHTVSVTEDNSPQGCGRPDLPLSHVLRNNQGLLLDIYEKLIDLGGCGGCVAWGHMVSHGISHCLSNNSPSELSQL